MSDIEPYYMEILTILIKYKFANIGTAESNTDDICNIFIKHGIKIEKKKHGK